MVTGTMVHRRGGEVAVEVGWPVGLCAESEREGTAIQLYFRTGSVPHALPKPCEPPLWVGGALRKWVRDAAVDRVGIGCWLQFTCGARVHDA